ncbi:peptidase [Bacteroidia bacterium]|nr:peptidase [Bacteroidia bacterium]
MKINFEHKPAAHCESGVTSNMLRYYGIDISEPMVLGLGAGLFFSYMPFITMHGMPVISFRPLPGQIFARVAKRLHVKISTRLYPMREDQSMKALDKLLLNGKPVGIVVGVFFLPYFPKEYRFHFNAHNLCVIGKEEDVYTVSDPVSLVTNQLNSAELKRVRFAKGTYPPMGKMYWVKKVSTQSPDLKTGIISGIKLNCKRMLDIPIPYFGVKGIALMANKMRRWETKLGSRKAALHLAQTIRMLEEIGTGGAGFRYMYAAFLQEAAAIVEKPELKDFSQQMTSIGDLWRDFAYEASRKFKKRNGNVCSYDQLADKLVHISEEEKRFFTGLRKFIQ